MSPSNPQANVGDRALAQAFLRELFGLACPGQLVLCTAPPGNDRNTPLTPHWFEATDLSGAAALAALQTGHVWFAVGVQRERLPGAKRGSSKTVIAILGFWLDVDVLHGVHKKSNLPPTTAAAMELIGRVGLTPTVVVDTGHGLQAYWLFHEPLIFADDAQRQAIQELLNGFKTTVASYAKEQSWSVDAVADLARLMRLPGTLNVKEPSDPRPVRIHAHHPECRYTLDQIKAVVKPPLQAAATTTSKIVNEVGRGRPDEALDHLPDDFNLIERAKNAGNGRKFAALWDGNNDGHGGDASAADLALCILLAFWTGKHASRMDRIFRMSSRWRSKWDQTHYENGDTYGAHTVATAIAKCSEVYDPEHGRVEPSESAVGGQSDSGGVGKPVTMGPPIPLDAKAPPPMPDDVFTGWLGDMIGATARATETPPELAGMLALAVLASVAQKRFTIRPEKGYFETLALWTVCALVPGNRKSAVLGELVRVLIAWESDQAKQVGEKRLAAESIRKTQEARIAELRSQVKKKSGPEFMAGTQEIAKLESELVEIPPIPRLFCQDVTPERLGSLIAENGERIAILSDEGGIFDLLGGRYSDGLPNIDLVLQAHNGSPVRVDRGSRPPVVLNHPALSMGISPQPGVLAGLTKHKGFRDRGLLARVLYAVPVSRLGYRTLEPCPIPDAVKSQYDAAIRSLADVPPNELNGEERARMLILSPAAWRVWKAWAHEIEAMMREGGRLEHLTDWGGKLPGATARIAGLLHLADYASCPASASDVPESTMRRAITFSRFLLEHALIAFHLMGADEGMEAARRLWKSIEARRLETFTARDAWHPLRGLFKRAADVEPGFEVLVEHNYIEEMHTADRGKPGRPSRKFRVNPAILEGWR